MNGWQLSFYERFDHRRSHDIVLPLKLSSNLPQHRSVKNKPYLIRLKVGVTRLDRRPFAVSQFVIQC